MSRINDFTLTRFTLPLERVIGDSQVRYEKQYVCVLELHLQNGTTGTGFVTALQSPLPPLTELQRIFEVNYFPMLKDDYPQRLLNRLTAPRGGNRYTPSVDFSTAVDTALWDLVAKQHTLPLHQLLGSNRERMQSYASMLGFHEPDDAVTKYYQNASKLGFRGFKVKVGYLTVEQDLQRLQTVYSAVPSGSTIMIDTNEGWTPREAIRRLWRYREEGFHIYWTEDPCLRTNFAGLREIKQSVPYTYVNAGEYLDVAGRRALLESKSVDVLNLNGKISDNLKIAWLAEQYDTALALGNTEFEVGIHMALAFPLVSWIEFSSLNYRHLFESYITFEDGYAIAPDLPGHGIRLSDDARTVYAVSDDANDSTPQEVPLSPIMSASM